MNYYFLIASLPMLKRENQAPFSSADFMNKCADILSEKLFSQLNNIQLIPKKGETHFSCQSEEKWNDFETALRNHVVTKVAHQTKLDASNFLNEVHNVYPALERDVGFAFDAQNPIDLDKLLDETRWKFLENLTVSHDFDFDALCIYKIKLMLLEKWTNLSAKVGEENLNQTIEKILENVKK